MISNIQDLSDLTMKLRPQVAVVLQLECAFFFISSNRNSVCCTDVQCVNLWLVEQRSGVTLGFTPTLGAEKEGRL